MRDFVVLAIILGSVPICLVNPYFGILMWFWVTYFNPHKFAWSYAHNFPVAMCVALPTLAGFAFAKKSFDALKTFQSALLMGLWAWFILDYFHAKNVPLFAGNMPDAVYEIDHMTKILVMTFVMAIVITSQERLRGVFLVSALSLGLLALKASVFGFRTSGETRVYGPPDSFLEENNAFAIALNMCLPILFLLARNEPRKWLRILLRFLFVVSIAGVLLTYSRGGLVGLAFVIAALILRSKHKSVGAFFLVCAAFLVVALAPPSWINRMGGFMGGNFDGSAEMRFISWGTAWNLSHDYPLTGGSFYVLQNVDVYQRYQPRPLPNGVLSSGPHSIYFQLLADQGFVGLGLFLLLIGSCFWTLHSIRRVARRVPPLNWLVDYSLMIEISILAFMTSGAFLGFVYIDVIYQMIGLTIALKVLMRKELLAHVSQIEFRRAEAPALDAVPSTT